MAEVLTGGVSDDGFLQRFLVLVWPDISRERQDVDRPVDSRAERRVEDGVGPVPELSPEDPLRTHHSPAVREHRRHAAAPGRRIQHTFQLQPGPRIVGFVGIPNADAAGPTNPTFCILTAHSRPRQASSRISVTAPSSLRSSIG